MAGDNKQPGAGQPPRKQTKLGAAIAREVATALAPFTKFQQKTNAQLRDLRKLTQQHGGAGAAGGGDAAEPEPTPRTAAGTITREDLDAAVELGQLRAKVPASLLAEHQEELAAMSHAEQARALRWISRAQGTPTTGTAASGDGADAGGVDAAQPNPTKPGREAATTRTTSRGAPPPSSKGVPRPRSLQELRQLAVSNPKAFEALDKDPTFDPAELPSVIAAEK